MFNGYGSGVYKVLTAKTASYTLVDNDCGKIFTTRGAGGTVTFTLPALADIATGWNAKFYGVAGQTMAITAPANKLTVFNNATATTATFSTSSELIGACAEVIYDGTTYLLVLMTEETQTVTMT